MNSQKALRRLGCGLILIGAACAWQRPFRVYPSMEPYDDIPLPGDWQDKSEWVFGRLMYPQHPQAHFSRYSRRFGGVMDWREGGTSWTQDYPRADRHFAQALRRLTRVDARSVEQPVNLDDPGDVFYWPWLCAGEMGDWKLTDSQAKTLREYLLRGGFLMLDDFWGTEEYARFEESMKRVSPSTTWTTGIRLPASGRCAPGGLTATTAKWRTGAVSTTTRAGSWWRCRLTRTSGIRGNGRTSRSTRRSIPRWEFASASIM